MTDSTESTVTTEREDLISSLARHRGFLLQTAEGLTEEQARRTSTVSALTIASLLKHVADTEESWIEFALRGEDAMAADHEEVDWTSSDFVDTRFVLSDEETLDRLRERIAEVATRTEEVLRDVDLNRSWLLPEAPWYEGRESWTVRRVALHILAETSQHAGHADIIREAIDGQKTMG